MSRLEEIRNNIQNCTDWYADNALFVDDIEYLLNEVERLKVALRLFADKSNWMGKNKMEYPDMGIVEWDGEVNPIKLAQEALKEPTPD